MLNTLKHTSLQIKSKGALDSLLDQLGIKLVPINRRCKAAQSHARATMKSLRAQQGDGFLIFILRLIRQSKGNRDQLHSDVIAAIADIFILHPQLMEHGSTLFDVFDQINLKHLRENAKKLRPWPVRSSLRIFIYQELRGLLDEA